MALKGKQAKDASLGLNLLKTNATAANAGQIMVFDANNALAIYEPLVFGASDVSMTGDIIVTGDLNISGGAISSLDTVDVSLEDNIIRVAGSASSAADGGFQLNKSGGGSVSLQWKETAGEWKVSLADASEHVIADVAAMELADGAVQQGIIDQNAISVAAEGVLTAGISTESGHRLLADQSLSGTVNNNTSTLSTTLGTSQGNLTTEQGRSSAARGVISGLLTTENTRATTAEGVIQSAISGEATRAGNAETLLGSDITAEGVRALAKEAELNTLIGNETNRALAGEAAINAKITGQTASRIYEYDSLDYEIGDIRYGDEASSFVIGTHTGAEGEGENRTLHASLDLTLSNASTVSAGATIQSFSAYTENDAKVAESELDNNRFNSELMRAIQAGQPGDLEWYPISSYVDGDGNLTSSGTNLLSNFNAGVYSFDNLKTLVEKKYISNVAMEAYHMKKRSESLSYSHTVTHSISSTVSSGILTIPAMEVVSSVYNYDNIAGYWGVTAGGADLRNWANIGDVGVFINGLQASEDAISYTVADKAGVTNGTYDAIVGVSSYASSRYGGADGELAVQITSILINVDKVGYAIDSDDVIEIIYDKRRAKAATEGYSPDAEVTECGIATASNYVPNAFAYNNSLCQYTFSSFSIAASDDVQFRIALPLAVTDGRWWSGTNYEGSGSQGYSYYQNAIGDLSIEIGTVTGANDILTPISTQVVLSSTVAGSSQSFGAFPGGAELSGMRSYGQGSNFQGLQSGRHYMKITGSLSNNPHFSRALMVEMYKNTGQGTLDIDVADKYFSFGGPVYWTDFVDDGDNDMFFWTKQPAEREEFPDGIFELGKLYYFSVA